MIIAILFLAYNYSNTSVNKLSFRHPLDKIHDNGSTQTSEVNPTEITDADGATETYEDEIDEHSHIEMQPNKSGNGYMLTLMYSDQGTGAFVNLMCFRCLASTIGGLRIVEPFIVAGSRFGLELSMTNWTEQLKFSDIFDSGAADKFAKRNKFSDLVSFGEFLKDAPRKLLVAQHRCIPCSVVCGSPEFLEKGRTFAGLYGFEVVGEVCLQYDNSGKTPISDIERQLYKEYKKSEVTVLFVSFGGIQKGKLNPNRVFRLYISAPAACYRNYDKSFPAMRPSHSVRESADHYVKEYLHNRKYMSVMIRIEIVLGSMNKATKEARTKTENCLRSFIQHLRKIKHDTGIEDVFMCLDIGKYGSGVLRAPAVVDNLGPVFDSFFSHAIGNGTTLTELDGRFTNTTLIDKPGFVAMMQKTIAARGDVLVLLGVDTSSFQKSTLEMYKSLHKKQVFTLNNTCK